MMPTAQFFNPQTMLLQSILFLTTWSTLHLYSTHHGPFPSVSTFTKYNSRFYSFLSFLLLLLILSPSSIAQQAYHLSKLWEYIDILGVVAAGGRVDAHFGFHHTTTVWLTYVRVLPEGENDAWRWFAAANAAHHVLMYAYFGGWNSERVRRVLLWTGQVQLVVGMVADAVVVWERLGGGKEVWRFGVSAGLLGTYMVLSLREMRSRRREEEQGKEQ